MEIEIFGVPLNMKLQAVPVYELYDNAARYGPQFAGIPYWISKYVVCGRLTYTTSADS